MRRTFHETCGRGVRMQNSLHRVQLGIACCINHVLLLPVSLSMLVPNASPHWIVCRHSDLFLNPALNCSRVL